MTRSSLCWRIRITVASANAQSTFTTAKGHQILKRVVMITEVLIGVIRKPPPHTCGRRIVNRSSFACSIIEQHQLIWIGDRERLQHYSVNEREDCGVGTDTQGKRDNRHRCETRTFKETTNSI